jgi:hypothetical protein
MSRVKDTYWHSIAHVCLSAGLQPAQVARVVINCFPKTEINGRHIGAYKRRMITEGLLDIVTYPSNKGRMTSLEMIDYCRSVVTKEDEFIYTASIGSIKRSLKCFEYTLTAEAENELDKVDIWLTKIKR